MYTTIDERKGLVKTDWENVRDRVHKVEPKFATLVDKLSPGKSFSLYLMYIPYGDLKGDTESTLIPKVNGGYYRLSDANAPKHVLKDLGYGKGSAPLGLLLEKNLELFLDLPLEGVTIPKIIYSPGNFISIVNNISTKGIRRYTSNKIFSMMSGARSVFMLPNVGCTYQHRRLQSHLNVKADPPKTLYEQWKVFKEIYDNQSTPDDWRSCILVFSEKWINKLYTDPAWQIVKNYLHDISYRTFQYALAAHSHYESAFSIIQKQRHLKPNPYLVDTARTLFSIALGDAPGYAPACDEEALPVDLLQAAYVDTYGLKKYYPTMMQPKHFSFETDKSPIYYSLQHPSTHVFSPSSRKNCNTLIELREIEHIIGIFLDELSKEDTVCSDTILGEIAKSIELKYYHNEFDKHKIILPSADITRLNPKFECIKQKHKLKGATFGADSPFLRGCISIRVKD